MHRFFGRLKYFLIISGLVIVQLLFFGANCRARSAVEQPWTLFSYGGQWTDNTYGEIVLHGQSEFQNSYLWTAGVGRRVFWLTRHLEVEKEINVTRHSGDQDHLEFNAAISFRWWSFPWQNFVQTTVSHGLGPSVAVNHPEVEKGSDGSSDRLLLYMQTELTLAPAEYSDWALLLRLHHRSGVFGLISEDSGSNYLALGLRYRF